MQFLVLGLLCNFGSAKWALVVDQQRFEYAFVAEMMVAVCSDWPV
jgi:hypothetical protein